MGGISSLLTRKSEADGKKVIVSDDVIKQLTRRRIIVAGKNGELRINRDPDEMMRPSPFASPFLVEGNPWSDEEFMLRSGILSKTDGQLKVNEITLQAMSILANAFGVKLPHTGSEVETVSDDDTSPADREKVQSPSPPPDG
jgi:hypothetical protein